MSSSTMRYFETEDILHLALGEGHEASSVELSPNITAELDESGALIGIEVLNASHYIRDSILESAQAKLLALAGPSGQSSPRP